MKLYRVRIYTDVMVKALHPTGASKIAREARDRGLGYDAHYDTKIMAQVEDVRDLVEGWEDHPPLGGDAAGATCREELE